MRAGTVIGSFSKDPAQMPLDSVSPAWNLSVNGESRSVQADADTPLLTVLRDHLGLTGAKYGCGEGQCGACAVLLDGAPCHACVTPVGAAAGRKIVTIEGLATPSASEAGGAPRLDPLQRAFLREGAWQCGYCTPGMILTAHALLRRNPRPSAAEIRAGMNGNLCRCCAYDRIVAAILRAAGEMTSAAGAAAAPGES